MLRRLSRLSLQHFLDVQLVGARQYGASLLHSHDTATRATMNMAVADGVIAAGQDGTCCVMKAQLCRRKEGGHAAANGESRQPGPQESQSVRTSAPGAPSAQFCLRGLFAYTCAPD